MECSLPDLSVLTRLPSRLHEVAFFLEVSGDGYMEIRVLSSKDLGISAIQYIALIMNDSESQ